MAAGSAALPAPAADATPSLAAWAAALPEKIPVGSAVLQARWQAWRVAAGGAHLLRPAGGRGGALAADADDDLDARAAATDRVRNGLINLDSPGLLFVEPAALSPPAVSAAVDAAVVAHREAELAALSSGLVPGVGPPVPPSADELAATAGRFVQWAADLRAMAVDFRVAGPAAGAIWVLDDLPGRPDRGPRWAARAVDGDLDVLPAARASRRRLDRLAALLTQDRPALLAAARGATTFEVGYAAWQALTRSPAASPAWLARAGDLAADDELRAGLAKLGPPPAFPALVAAEAAARWATFAAAAGDEAWTREAARSLHARVGRTPAGPALAQVAAVAPPPARLNLALFVARDLLAPAAPAGAPPAEADLTAARAAVAAAAAALPPARADAAGLRRRLALPEPFRGRAAGDRFDLPLPDGTAVPMLRVERSGRRAFYLSADEVTVGQFAAAVQSRDAPPKVLRPAAIDLLRAAEGRVVGPRVWRLDGGGVAGPGGGAGGGGALAVGAESPNNDPRWLAGPRNDYADPLRAPPGLNRQLLAPAAGGPPSDAHPMQQVPATAALYVARALGCRLPTTDEWARATEVRPAGGGPVTPPPPPNLRDRKWDVQRRYAIGRREKNPDVPFPDDGAFVPTALRQAVAWGPDAAPRTDDAGQVPLDGTLYFLPAAAVQPGQPLGFRNLVGNVAELAFEDPDAADLLPGADQPTAADAVAGLLRDNRAKVRVIGLSALSAPQLRQAEAYPIDPDNPYADVGFRLAFTAPFTSEAARLAWVVGDQGYLRLADR